MLLSNLRVGVAGVVLVVFAMATIEAHTFSGIGRWFPWVIALAGTVLSFLNFCFEIRRNLGLRRRMAQAMAESGGSAVVEPVTQSGPALDTPAPRTAAEFIESSRWFAVVVSCPATMFIFGAVFGAAVWVVAYMVFLVGRSWRFSIACSLGVVVIMLVYSHYLNLQLPGPVFIR